MQKQLVKLGQKTENRTKSWMVVVSNI